MSDDTLLAQVFVLIGREVETGTRDPDTVARSILARYGEPGVQALSRVVGAHVCFRMAEEGDQRRGRTIIREVTRRQKKRPESVLDDLGNMIQDISREPRYGPTPEMVNAAARLDEFRLTGGAEV